MCLSAHCLPHNFCLIHVWYTLWGNKSKDVNRENKVYSAVSQCLLTWIQNKKLYAMIEKGLYMG